MWHSDESHRCRLFSTDAMRPLPNTPSFVDSLQALFDERGGLSYGEAVTQLDHALQCGQLAEQDGAHDALVLACVLHDVGHLLHRDAAAALQQGLDDRHESLGARWLSRYLGPEVTEPIRLHVQAKRFLCARQQAYTASLSSQSIHTLMLQGGPMSNDEADAFGSLPYAQDAVRLRIWDDQAKRIDAWTPPISHFLSKLRSLATFTQSPLT